MESEVDVQVEFVTDGTLQVALVATVLEVLGTESDRLTSTSLYSGGFIDDSFDRGI